MFRNMLILKCEDDIMNNKGFTLVELLAVILVLIGVSLIAVSSISSSLGRREEKELAEQIELAKNAAKIYFSLEDKTCVKVGTLIDENYFNGTSKTDRLDRDDVIKFEESAYDYYSSAEDPGACN